MVTNMFGSEYRYLLEQFGEEKIKKRYETMYCFLEDYIDRHGLKKDVIISEGLLGQMVLDYFVDIARLKEFHDIDKTNATKICAYSAYWLLRRKPIQIIQSEKLDHDLVFVNEKFVCGYLMRYLTEDDYKIAILNECKQQYIEYIDNLMYFCQYRVSTPQMLETMLTAFQAGRSIQFSADYQNR